ncbi:MAG: Cof-type HAD-IIB family hydrolase [Clostridia bacterium]|nr:Cof-type HAD-IIB family hydrolase [Clostridia bacterium]
MKEIKEKYYDFAVSDFDGTLANSNSIVSVDCVNTINSFVSRGGIFTVCTGRMTGAIIPQCKQFGISGYVIGYNGGEICDIASGEKVYKKHIENNVIVKLLEYAEINGYTAISYPNDVITVSTVNEQVADYIRIAKINCHVLCEPLSSYFKKSGQTSGKILIYTNGDEEENNRILADLNKIAGDVCAIGMSNERHVDITQKSVSKGGAVKVLAKLVNKSMEKLICFGDQMNDISMLKVAALAVVTANANEKVKLIADVVTDSCDEDGVKKAIERYCI